MFYSFFIPITQQRGRIDFIRFMMIYHYLNQELKDYRWHQYIIWFVLYQKNRSLTDTSHQMPTVISAETPEGQFKKKTKKLNVCFVQKKLFLPFFPGQNLNDQKKNIKNNHFSKPVIPCNHTRLNMGIHLLSWKIKKIWAKLTLWHPALNVDSLHLTITNIRTLSEDNEFLIG